jgi:DNA-binding transcriptional ArsR family regulator
MIDRMKGLLDDEADALFQALADRTRRDIVRRVAGEGLSVSDLAADYDMSFAAVQKHVAVLERAGLVTKQRVGKQQIAHAEVGPLRTIRSMLAELDDQWVERVQRIDDLLAGDEQAGS